MTTLDQSHAQSILSWFDQYSETNWGGWSNYPTLPIGASYLQYDDVKCIIKLSGRAELASSELRGFKYISTSRRNCPGAKNPEDVITFSDLREYVMTDEERLQKQINGYAADWSRAKKWQQQQRDYENQRADIKELIQTLRDESKRILGTPHSVKRQGEIHRELSGFVMPFEIPSHATWITEAQRFDNEDDYVRFKLDKK